MKSRALSNTTSLLVLRCAASYKLGKAKGSFVIDSLNFQSSSLYLLKISDQSDRTIFSARFLSSLKAQDL